MKIKSGRRVIALAGLILFGTNSAMAATALQLYINGATYNNQSQTWVSNSPNFVLGAYLNTANGNADLPGDPFYISSALLPDSSASGNYGSFSFAGTTVSATSGMVRGTPTILPTHDIFPAWYYQSPSFSFTGGTRYNAADLDNTFSGTLVPNTSGAMYERLFTIDMSNLDPGMTLHFDLYTYNTTYTGGSRHPVAHLSINNAPFSHDAEGTPTNHRVSEPGTMMLLGSGLVSMIVMRRRYRRD